MTLVNKPEILDKVEILITSLNIQKFFENNFRAGIKKQPTLLGHILLAGSLTTVLSVSYFLLNSYADDKAKIWLISQVDSTAMTKGLNAKESEDLRITATKELNAKESEKLRITAQLKTIDLQIDRYSKIMIFFSNHYYTAIVLTSTSALVAAICLFFISKKGWEQAHNSLINVFIVASSAVVFFGDLPGIFKEEENFKAYSNLYIEHIALKNEILSYCATGGTILGIDPEESTKDKAIPLDANEFIHRIDNRLAQLNKIPLGFDATGINNISGTAARFNSTIQPSAPSQ